MKLKLSAKWIICGALTWVFCIVALLVFLFPAIPTNAKQWITLAAIGPPIWLLCEMVGELFSNKIGKEMTRRGISQRGVVYSVLIIATLFIFGIVIVSK